MVTIADAHNDLIHDAVLDYYGKRLATASLDKTIRLFDIEGTDNYRLVETLAGHEGPVWQVAWAHPKFGSILALCAYDGKVIVWKEQDGQWLTIAEHTAHQASVNLVSWAPHELGAVLLCTSLDGRASVMDFNEDGTTLYIIFDAHQIGANLALWAPAAGGKATRRFVTCGLDNLAKVWRLENGAYVEEARLEAHSDWVRDVLWLPLVLVRLYIATASQDRTVVVWLQDASGSWHKQALTQEPFPDVCWRVLWLLSGNVLAVLGGDNKVTLWKENMKGQWESAGEVEQ